MNKQIKAVFFDVDGTLVSHRTHGVNKSTIQSIEQLRKQGILTIVATGRHPIEIARLLPDELKFDAYLCLNGMLCLQADQLISSHPIDKQDLHHLLQYLKDNPFPCIFINQYEMYINYANALVQRVQKDISSQVPTIKDTSNTENEDILQLIPYGLSDEQIQSVLNIMPHSKATSWHPDARDIIAKGGGKDKGIQEILEYYHLDASECMAFGDGDNDVSMLKMVGLSIAMGNGNDNVKQVANYITKNIDDDGIYHALRKYRII